MGIYVDTIPAENCGSISITELVVLEIPLADAGEDLTVNAGDTLSLSAEAPSSVFQYEWIGSDGTSFTGF